MTADRLAELRRWAPFAPGGVGAAAAALGRAERALAGALHDLRARPWEPTPGVAWAPVVDVGGLVPGMLLPVFATGEGEVALPAEGVARARGFVAWHGGVDEASLPPWPLRRGSLPPGVALEGRSWELAAALALWSRLTGSAPGTVVSGAVTADGGLIGVEHADLKRAVAGVEAPGAAVWVVTQDVPAEAALAALAAGGGDASGALADVDALRATVGLTPGAVAWEAWNALITDDRRLAGRRAADARRLGAADRALGLVTWVEAALALHRGDAEAALRGLAAAEPLLRASGPRPPAHEEAVHAAWLAVALLDLGRVVAADGVLARAEAALNATPLPYRGARWGDALLRVLGSWHRVRVALGDLEGAAALLRRSLDDAHVPAERARTLGDLAEVLRRAGEADEARASLRAARAALGEVPPGDLRTRTARFLDLYSARLGGPAPWTAGAPAPERWPQPAEAMETAARAGTLAAWATAYGPELTGPLRLALLTALARAGLGPDAVPKAAEWARSWPADGALGAALAAYAEGDPTALAAIGPY
jgi:tetratricopeptide (TPR) repeat protein